MLVLLIVAGCSNSEDSVGAQAFNIGSNGSDGGAPSGSASAEPSTPEEMDQILAKRAADLEALNQPTAILRRVVQASRAAVWITPVSAVPLRDPDTGIHTQYTVTLDSIVQTVPGYTPTVSAIDILGGTIGPDSTIAPEQPTFTVGQQCLVLRGYGTDPVWTGLGGYSVFVADGDYLYFAGGRITQQDFTSALLVLGSETAQ